jgi:NAD+ synthase
VRLPYETQFDERRPGLGGFIEPDERHTVNIGPAVKSLANEVAAFEGKHAVSVDFVLGNTKARMRMVASTPSPARPTAW